MNISEQINKLPKTNGWLKGSGKRIRDKDLYWFKDKIKIYLNDNMNPLISQTPTGNVQLKWVNKNLNITLEIDFSTKIGYYHYNNLINNECFDKSFFLIFSEQWNLMFKEVDKILNKKRG